jgi:hypothetical protein
MTNITYKITVEKGWCSFEQKVFKTFYFKDFAYVNDLLFRLQRNQKIGFRSWGKIQMEQLLNSDVEPTVNRYREYAKLVLGLGMEGDQYSSFQRFSNMIERIVKENSTPVTYKKFKKDYKTRIWFSDVVEGNYPRSTRFLDKNYSQKIKV